MKIFFSQLYNELKQSLEQSANQPIQFSTSSTSSATNIVKPRLQPPIQIRHYLTEFSKVCLTYYDLKHNTHVHFLLKSATPNKIKQYNTCAKRVFLWLNIIQPYIGCSTKCKELSIFIYCTPLKKRFPASSNEILDVMHVNTAFTQSCPVKGEILIFRKEEWFKVFLHETMHTFGLDFSTMNKTDLNKCNLFISSLFHVYTDVHLYEAYAEFWARILNVVFVSYHPKKSLFINQFQQNIQKEIRFSCHQSNQVLKFMGLTYNQLCKEESIIWPLPFSKVEEREEYLASTIPNGIGRKGRIWPLPFSKVEKVEKVEYKEKTNVFSYYIVTSILMSHYEQMIDWAVENNDKIITFQKTPRNIQSFCHFIQHHYLSLPNVQPNVQPNNTLRMTICEWDENI